MKRKFPTVALGIAAFLLLCSGPLWAQGAVVNGDFETGSVTPLWTLTGGNANTTIITWSTAPGLPSYCLRRRPGPPNDNGGIEQSVFLMGGVSYVFSADIASQYCAS